MAWNDKVRNVMYEVNNSLPPITKETQPLADQIVQKVSEILMLTQSLDYETNREEQLRVKELEREIDWLVCKLYGLSEEEIELVEGDVSKDVGCV